MKQQLVFSLLGSELKNAEKEAMVGLLLETMKIKGKKVGEKIYTTEFLEVIRSLEKEGKLPSVYNLQPQNCWNAFWEMGDEKLLIIHQKDSENNQKGAWVMLTPGLVEIVSPETPIEEKKQILALCEQNKQKAEEAKKQKAEQEKIKKPAPKKVEHQEAPETGIRKYLPKFLKR